MSVKTWETLECPQCSGKEFVSVHNLQYQTGLGTSTRPVGYACLACQKVVDMAAAVSYAKAKELRAQIKDLEGQIGQ